MFKANKGSLPAYIQVNLVKNKEIHKYLGATAVVKHKGPIGNKLSSLHGSSLATFLATIHVTRSCSLYYLQCYTLYNDVYSICM